MPSSDNGTPGSEYDPIQGEPDSIGEPVDPVDESAELTEPVGEHADESSEPTEPADSATPGTTQAAVASIGARKLEQSSKRRKIILLATLLALLALLAWVAYYVNANKRLPLPQTETARAAMQAPEYLYSITGTGRQTLNRPVGVVVGRDGRVYVVDSYIQGIKVFTTAGNYLFSFRNLKDGKATGLDTPVHLALDPQGNVWVTDRGLHGLYVFSPDGKFIRKILLNNNPKAVWSPLAITIDASGTVYTTDVAATAKHQVMILDSAGKLIAQFGQTQQVKGAQEAHGSFYFPNGIAVRGVGDKREIYVVDGDNRRIQVFSATGAFKRLIETQGVPRGAVFDRLTPRGETLVVADALANQVDIYSVLGEHLTQFGAPGPFDGQFQFPNDVALDTAGRIFITDRENNRVQVWGFPKAEVVGITVLPPGVSPWWCALPLLLLPLLLLLRKKKFVVTPDFVEGMVTAGHIPDMNQRKFRWVMREQDYPPFENRVEDGVQLGELLDPEPYSQSDAADLASRLQISIEEAGLLAMARRYKRLCTEDEDLARLAIALEVEVFDRLAWLEKYGLKTPAVGEGE